MTPRTVGVEEEFLLVDAEMGGPVAIGPAIAEAAADAWVKGEFKQEQVEVCSRPTASLDTLASDLKDLRRRVSGLAATQEAVVVASGTWPGEHLPTPVVSDRFDRIGKEFGELASQQLTCGTHVHVSVDSPDEGVAVLDGLRPWLAVLTAVTANSPYWHGRDTGHASWRSIVLSQLPTAGPAPLWRDVDTYRRTADAVVAGGGAFDAGMLYYDARLSARYPTVEVRVTDVVPDPTVAVAVAGLCRALVDTVAGDPPAARVASARFSTLALRTAAWRAARHGLGERLLDPATGDLVPAKQAVGSLLAFTSDALEAHGDLAAVQDVVDRLLAEGTSADRQRLLVDPRHPAPGLAAFQVG
ncbi:glutamate--cysteine ligase [Knoellia flava]|uniref:Putative glutamate--cysteine ligase 2 n=1 Tax=Knoellia flava TaxID=913969 RepID=A0A8H9FSM4_9MICO|nr:glutamate--cysteine ligase [Knoellia flava]GGB80417.1 putative glutamate--cysteine ligase 2 [Knoellia flava]